MIRFAAVGVLTAGALLAQVTTIPPPAGGSGGGGTGAVDSVFGRVGIVAASAGDYNANQVTNAVDQAVAYDNPTWLNSLAWAKITGAPAPPVLSVFGRVGAVVQASGDYTAAQVTNALSSAASYSDPPWLLSLAWSKLTGVPNFITNPLTTKGDLLARDATVPVRLGVGTDGQILTADSAQAAGLRWSTLTLTPTPLTPWTSNINADNYFLTNLGAIGIGTAANSLNPIRIGTVVTGPVVSITNTNAAAASHLAMSNDTGKSLVVGVAGSTSSGAAANHAFLQAFGSTDLLFLGGGTERMRLTQAGNLGIGTANPLNALQVRGAADQNLGIRFDGAKMGIGTYNDAGTVGVAMNLNATSFEFMTGNVGIGTNQPVRKLHVAGIPVGGGIALTGGAPNFIMSNVDTEPNTNTFATFFALSTGAGHFALPNVGDAIVATQGASRGDLYLDANYAGGGAARKLILQSLTGGGNVGIATPSPTERLDVVGAIRSRGNSVAGAANSATFDFYGGSTRIISGGPNTSTRGGMEFIIATSNSTGVLNAMSVLPTGRVGIFNTVPAYALDVTGDVNVTGAFRVNGVPKMSMQYISTTPGEPLGAGATQNTWFTGGSGASFLTSEELRMNVMTEAGRVNGAKMVFNGQQPPSGQMLCSLRKNGAFANPPIRLTVPVNADSATVPVISQDVPGSEVTFVPNDRLSWQCQNGATSPSVIIVSIAATITF
jgi:hypothetical protein